MVDHPTNTLSVYLCLQFLSSRSYFQKRSFTSFVKFMDKFFIVFDAIINGINLFLFQKIHCRWIEMLLIFCRLILYPATDSLITSTSVFG